jgi:predicted secreted protein
MPGGVVLGLDAALYIDLETNYVTPTWSLVSNCRDLTLNLEKNDADVTTRGANGWRQRVAVLKDASVEFEMVWNTADPNFQMIQAAFLAITFPQNTLNVAVMDGPITGHGQEGLKGSMMVSSFTRKEPLEDALKVDVKFIPTYDPPNQVNWYTTP